MKRGKPLKRKTPLKAKKGLKRTGFKSSTSPRGEQAKRPSKPPKPRKAIKARSTAQSALERQYGRLRHVWATGRICEGPECFAQATDVHHKRGRGRLYMLDVDTWAALCRSCHQWIEEHPREAEIVGLKVSRLGSEPMAVANSADMCRSCTAWIYWAKTINGESMPLDADRYGYPIEVEDNGKAGRIVPYGNEQLEMFPKPMVVSGFLVDVLSDGQETDGPVHQSHFATCPDAKAWKRS